MAVRVQVPPRVLLSDVIPLTHNGLPVSKVTHRVTGSDLLDSGGRRNFFITTYVINFCQLKTRWEIFVIEFQTDILKVLSSSSAYPQPN
jgi:hypothetical protein